MANPYPSRTKTYAPNDQVASADLNAIQDGIIACSTAIGDTDELDGDGIIDDLIARTGKIRIVPWAAGAMVPAFGSTAHALETVGSGPRYVQATSLNAIEVPFGIDRYYGQFVIEKITGIRVAYARSSGSAVLEVKLRQENALTGTETTLQTATATSTTGAWTVVWEAFDQAIDMDTNLYFLTLEIDCDATQDEVKVRWIEFEWEGKYIGS